MALTNKAFKKLMTASASSGAVVEPRCPHADECGGCAFQDRAYTDQVAAKAAVLTRLWYGEDNGEPQTPPLSGERVEVVPSPDPFAYRTRMDYVATKGRFGLRKPGRFNYIIDLHTCHIIPPAAFDVARLLWQQAQTLGLPDYNIRSHEGFLRYIVVRRSPQDTFLLAAVTAAGAYDREMEHLAHLALDQPGVQSFFWLLNDSLTDLSFGEPLRHWGAETLPMQVGTNTLHIGPNTFFQNNVHLLLPLLEAVREAATASAATPPRVADLYSGVGAIALHLAPHASSITAVESHAESTDLARYNAELNGAARITLHTADVLDFLRTQETGLFDVVVADPPRTGLGPEVCRELLRLAPPRIVYVSCNPLTQRDDVGELTTDYRLTTLHGYDMFPHTPHVEALAVLDRVR